ncbi:hypothetical protein JHK82_012659 [Glycine max]|nr:hypothetical protein JHK82_012659 [Glycine max]
MVENTLVRDKCSARTTSYLNVVYWIGIQLIPMTNLEGSSEEIAKKRRKEPVCQQTQDNCAEATTKLVWGKAKLPFGKARKMVLMPPGVKSRFLILRSNK